MKQSHLLPTPKILVHVKSDAAAHTCFLLSAASLFWCGTTTGLTVSLTPDFYSFSPPGTVEYLALR